MPTIPLLTQTPVFIAGEDGVCEYRIPALVCTNEGTLLAACDARVDTPGDAAPSALRNTVRSRRGLQHSQRKWHARTAVTRGSK